MRKLTNFLDLPHNFLNRLAILYAQLRLVTLPRRGITAAAGTSLARDSNKFTVNIITCGQTLQLS